LIWGSVPSFLPNLIKKRVNNLQHNPNSTLTPIVHSKKVKTTTNIEELGKEEGKTQQDTSLNNSKGETKPTSTGISLTDYDKKGSMLSQMNTFDSSSILVKNPKDKFSESSISES
jgi:hypothetical protein